MQIRVNSSILHKFNIDLRESLSASREVYSQSVDNLAN